MPKTPLLRGFWLAVALMLMGLVAMVPPAQAQSVGQIVDALESDGYYIEPGAEGDDGDFADLVQFADNSDDLWYFVSLSSAVGDGFAIDLADELSPSGNVVVYHPDDEGFVVAKFESPYSEATEDAALAATFDLDWDTPDEFMRDLVEVIDSGEFASAGSSSSSGSSGAAVDRDSGSQSSSSSGGSGFPWLIVIIPVVLIGGFIWYSGRKKKQAKRDSDVETAAKIRAEIQTELDELANDVLVLSGPIDLSDKPEAVRYYREASARYIAISDDIEDIDDLKELETADLRELSELGASVAHARWQMDAAEAILDGEPIPEKPKVEPPPAPKLPPPNASFPKTQLPQRAPRPRVSYSSSRRRSGGGLLDILIAGAGMLGSSRGSGGGMFGGSSRSRTSSSRSSSSRGGGMFGGMFGGGSRSSSSGSRPSGGVFGSSSTKSRSSKSRSRSSGRSRSSSSSRRSSSRSKPSRSSTSRRKRR